MNELLLKKELYRKTDIDQVIEAFQPLGLFVLSEFQDYYSLMIIDNKLPLEKTIREFENYLINLAVKEKAWQ